MKRSEINNPLFRFTLAASSMRLCHISKDRLKKSKHVCFKRIFISGMYTDGRMFDGKEDHVWMDKSGFEEYAVGDGVSLGAEVYRYVKPEMEN